MDRTARAANAYQQPKTQSIKRAILWVIALAATSALFPAEIVLGGDQFRYRPGLRNTPSEKKLDEKQLDTVIKALREKTGFAELCFDGDGFLTIGDRTNVSGGSASARELLIATTEMKNVVELESCPRSSIVSFARIGNPVVYESRMTGAKIEAWSIQIDFSDFSSLQGDKEALAAFDPGFVIIHELGHAVLGLRDSYDNSPGDCEEMVNRVRRELNLPERQTYLARVYSSPSTPLALRNRRAQLIFKKNNGKIDGKSVFRLDWDAQQVGPILDQIVISPAKTRNPKTISSSISGQ